MDLHSLEARLRKQVRGVVRFDDGIRAMYATDASNYRQVPIGVVLPANVEDVIATVAVARDFDVPVLSRGAGTSLAGQCCNVAIVMDFSRYVNRILKIDPEEKTAEVEPGVILDDLRSSAENYGLTFGPDPATHSRCTLGGMIGNNSCGMHSVFSGKTEDNVEELEVLTFRGLQLKVGKTSSDLLGRIRQEGGDRAAIYAGLDALQKKYADLIRSRFPAIPRRVSGYNLNQLLPENGFDVARALVGSEGTCVTVLRAKLRLVHSPRVRILVVFGFKDFPAAGDHVMQILAHKPLALEGMDDQLIEAMRTKSVQIENVALLPAGGGWLLVEFGGESQEEALEKARSCLVELTQHSTSVLGEIFVDQAEQKRIWKIRESALGATAHVPGKKFKWEGWEDSAVAPEKIGSYVRDLRSLADQFHYECPMYGHLGDGCVHTRIDFDLQSTEGIKKFRRFIEEAADLVVRYGGSLSGEHGDGQSRGELLSKMFGPELVEAFREFKSIWDPDNRMNPGKVVDANRLDDNLRLGASYQPLSFRTHFHFSQDEGRFSNATLRCVGVGECRRTGGGLMCPSYMATLDETHSTRGRARLLFEMMQGDVLKQGWQSNAVKESLDLCISCKGCKKDCPVQVDMASYKAEFLSHFYKGKVRPMSAYVFGLIPYWVKLGALAPRLTNFVAASALLKHLGGIASERSMPRFASKSFSTLFHKRKTTHTGSRRVILWPDTFNNYFYPEVPAAAARLLESAGYQVSLPPDGLCCGRPFYDSGRLDLAKDFIKNILQSMKNEIAEGTPIVGLEPGCVSVFRDELRDLFADNKDALKMSGQTFLLTEFLEKEGISVPSLNGNVVFLPHCHERSVLRYEDAVRVLTRTGMNVKVLDPACCGMAGGFGFERQNYDLSVRIGELSVLPSIRSLPDDYDVVADGFSCREQIRQLTGRKVYHPAEILAKSL